MFCQLEILERMLNISQWFLDKRERHVETTQNSLTSAVCDTEGLLANSGFWYDKSDLALIFKKTSSIQPHPVSLYGNIAFASDRPSLAGRWGGRETARQDIFQDKKWGKWMRNCLDSNTIPPLTNVLSERCRQSRDLGITGRVEKKNHVFREHFV